MKISLRTIVFAGLFAALTCIATMVIRVPLPFPGYYHAGDSLVYLGGIILGPVVGGLAAAIGSFFADIFSGFAAYALPTFIVKGLDACLAGYVFMILVKKHESMRRKIMALVGAVLVGGSVMVAGYFVTEVILSDKSVAMTTIIPNIIQASVGGVLSGFLFVVFEKAGLIRMISQKN